MPDSIKRLAAPGILPVGEVPDVQSIYERVRLVTAPMRFGAGVKGKVLEALAAGVPCVMTPIAAEGIALPDVLSGTIGADAAALAEQILRLYGSEAECRMLAQAGLEFIASAYREEIVVAALRAAIQGPRPVAATPTARNLSP
jgi:glycosyltransferase involved in cell wall biosynthesis